MLTATTVATTERETDRQADRIRSIFLFLRTGKKKKKVDELAEDNEWIRGGMVATEVK